MTLKSGPPEGGIRITAESIAAPKPPGDTPAEAPNCRLVLHSGSGDKALTQMLYTGFQNEVEGPRLLWAGDLDRDGRVDLFYNFGEHYTETRLMLFLSSAAKEGEIVGLVAQWTATCGC